jgi:integrase
MRYKLYPPGARKGNRTYVVRAWVNGRQVEKVLEATKRPNAESEADDLLSSIKGRDPSEVVTFRAAADAYKAAKRLRKQDLAYVERLQDYFGSRPVAEMVGADLIVAAHTLADGTSDANKTRAVIGPASAILHYASEQGWCPERRHRRLKVSRRSNRKPATPETIRLLLANTTGMQHLFLAWLYETGQRITASLQLRRDDLDLGRGIAYVTSNKTDDHGQLELSPELVVMLAKAEKQPSGRVFPWGDRHNVYRWLRPLCKRLGVSYTPHQSRHAMATDLRALGYDMKAITERGLWRDERSASRYVHHRSSAVPERGVVLMLHGDGKGKTKRKR